ncbi:MAG: GtrA family protein [Clostridia bacterium]|nr:GtrA family protein [Clostridia bacterium]
MHQKHTELWRTVKFTLFSVSAGIIQVGTYALFREVLAWEEWIAYLVSLILSVVWNFTLNRKFTFQSAANIPVAMAKVALFYLVFTPLSTWWTAALTGGETESLLAYAVQIGTMVVNFVTEYLYQRFFVFAGSIDSAKKE